MSWVRIGAVAAVLFAASYAQAAPPEAMLGAPAPTLGGGKPAGGAGLPLPKAPHGPAGAAGRYVRTLDRLKADGPATTRGARETGVYKKASPAVVLIMTKEAFGSGALITPDGKIITNLHVVGDATEVGVVFKPAIEGAAMQDGDVRRGRVIRRDEIADLALVQVAEVPPGVTPLEIGDSTSVQVGADVHAIGHPTGEAWTYTKGIVSQVRRAYDWHAEDDIPHEATVIQTQTPINPGNSGGPLLTDDLKIVGINSFKGEGEGLNFAVSAEDVKSFLARSGDRVSPNSPKRQAAAKAACTKVEALKRQHDDKERGTYVAMDETCDGKADYVAFFPDDKRSAVTMMYDDDGDGKIETVLIDKDWDGAPETGIYDTNGDGKPDLEGRFHKGEAEPYRYDRIKN